MRTLTEIAPRIKGSTHYGGEMRCIQRLEYMRAHIDGM